MRFPGDPSQKPVKALWIVFHLQPGRRARGCELRELGEEERAAGKGWLGGGSGRRRGRRRPGWWRAAAAFRVWVAGGGMDP